MKKVRLNAVFFAIGVATIISFCFSTPGTADVDVNIGINLPLPALVFPAPPPVVVIPGSYVYFVPGIDEDILFYHGYWYRPYRGQWYRAASYRGRWDYLSPHLVPAALIALPHDYRHIPPGYRKIPHREVTRKWRQWEREKHWDRDEGRGRVRRY